MCATNCFVCQSIYPSYRHTHAHAASAHLSCSLKFEAAHLGVIKSALRLKYVRVRRKRVMGALHVCKDRFGCQAIYTSYQHTHTHAASTHFSFSLRFEGVHLGSSNGSFCLKVCVCVCACACVRVCVCACVCVYRRTQVTRALHVCSDRFVCQAIYQSCNTHPAKRTP